jgi:hypothetical protein
MAAGLSLEEAKFEEFQRCLASWSPTGWIPPVAGEVVSDGVNAR